MSEQNADTNNQIAEKFPSAELLLSVIQKEYDYELARKTAFETRAGILLAFVTAILPILISYIKISDLKKIKITHVTEATWYIIYLIFVIIAMCALITAFIFLLKVFMADKYMRMTTKEFNQTYGKYPKDYIAISLTEQYRDIVQYNREKNNIKAKDYKLGTSVSLIGVILIILVYIISLNL
ncbi:hypothetical protein [Domibacillus tundrae]|uniref:hypothetical protein n=1 Tax=Domibacillus tundrae TaxID=1587527 RepID=UPI0006180EDB|nr:hypothetical protein [Domibacillus tundrae]